MTEQGRRPIPARGLATSRGLAAWLAARGVTPNQISLFGLAVGIGSGLALALTGFAPDWTGPLAVASAVFVGLRGAANMLDGMVAVEHGKASRLGMLYNELPDRISDVALMAGAGYAAGGSPVVGWLAACAALVVAYIRTLVCLAGAPADFGGLMAKQQRMFSLAGAALWLGLAPSAWQPVWGPGGSWGIVAAVLWLIVVGGVQTAWVRLRRAAAALNAPSSAG
ncbi:CDP-alcohol phosphatidyltransferase family protein [Nostoc sp. NIES-2111]